MASHYHRTGERLGLGHTFPIGGPWVPGSPLDHFLVSLPYPFGPDLEHLPMPEQNVRLLSLLPITKAEATTSSRAGSKRSKLASMQPRSRTGIRKEIPSFETRFGKPSTRPWSP